MTDDLTVTIKTKADLLRYITQAKEVLVRPRFGTFEGWVRTPKYEAIRMAESLGEIDLSEFDGEIASFYVPRSTLYIG